MRPRLPHRRRPSAFTLIEMMAAMAVLIILLAIIVGVTNSVSATVRRSTAGIDALAGARTGFDLLNRTLSKATLNTYWEYDNPLAPTRYLRQSDLQFLIRQNTQTPGTGQEVYFVAPETYAETAAHQATQGLFNACGAFVRFGSSVDFRPGALSGERFRYRLMFGLQPTEGLAIFNKPARSPGQSDSVYRAAVETFWNSLAWIAPVQNNGATGTGPRVTPIADNVIALVAWPRLTGSEDASGSRLSEDGTFAYNSQKNALATPQRPSANQLPPVIQLTMIVISEASAARLDQGQNTPPADIESALNGRFVDIARYEGDLKAVTEALSSKGIEHQVFTTSIPLRESKWSKAQ